MVTEIEDEAKKCAGGGGYGGWGIWGVGAKELQSKKVSKYDFCPHGEMTLYRVT